MSTQYNKYKADAVSLLHWGMEKAVEDMELIPFWLTGRARQSEGKPARIELVVPDDWVKNIAGYQDMQDTYVMVRVPKEVMQEWNKQRTPMEAPGPVNQWARLDKPEPHENILTEVHESAPEVETTL